MEQKIIATVGGHQITEAEVEAFIHSLPREQQVYAAHPDFRKECEEQMMKSKNIMKQINRNIRRVHLYMQNIS